MRRGNLTNEPAPIVAVDWRILVRSSSFFSGFRTKLEIIDGAREWIERNWDYRFCGVVIGERKLGRRIITVLEHLLAETKYVDNAADLRVWLKRNPEIVCMYTPDVTLTTLDGVIRPFHGWHEVVGE